MNRKVQSLVGLISTLAIIYIVKDSLTILIVLLIWWFLLFRPWSKTEFWMFIIASTFFVGQNYAVLKGGGFSFHQQDFLLMPYYEPFMWGFYFLAIKRFVSEYPETVHLNKEAIIGLLLTGLCFSIFSNNSLFLLLSTIVSTLVLFVMFHDSHDFFYAVCALCLGFIVEVFGVSTGLWSYPEPDFLGIPFWFATMWLSVGVLARRFLIPLAELIAHGGHSRRST